MSGNPSVHRLFSLKKMCPNCPWRADGKAIDLHDGRLRSICDELKADDMKPFFCHKTANGETVESDGGETHYQPDGSECYCIGAMAYLHRERRSNVVMRLGYALGEIDPGVIESTVPHIKQDADIT